MQVDDFDFDLPESLIALRPAQPRDTARLLHIPAAADRADKSVRDLPQLLRAGDALVVNTTKVIPARLIGTRLRTGGAGAKIEITLTERLGPVDWRCFMKPAKKVTDGDIIDFNGVSAVVSGRKEGEARLVFDLPPDAMETSLAELGTMPLPPYIQRPDGSTEADSEDYQTMFAASAGAVAAPTAGLHFTPRLMTALEAAGVGLAKVTLHVGAGTFLPVTVEDIADHRMHAEWGRIPAETAARINATRQAGGRIVAVGTTSLRILEACHAATGRVQEFAAETDIFITPGYEFGAVDMLLTNFHLPKSTLMMLVSAFAGMDPIRAAYAHALDRGYRFFSYGDACLLRNATVDSGG